MSHLEQRLQTDLTRIRDWVWNLGEQVEQAVRNAKRVLLVRDEALAYHTVLGDNPINRDSRKCDRLCHAFIATHLPSAGHLREMASTIRVNVALERVGDYAVTLCREALQLKSDLPETFQVQLDQLADDCLDILHQSREAFYHQNAELATALMSAAKRVESKMDANYALLMGGEHDLPARTLLVVFVSFSLLKRIADQAKNICDQTVYSVRGVAKILKVHKILFLDQPGAGRGLLASAIGREHYADAAEFTVATPGTSEGPSPELAAYLADNGMSAKGLATESTVALVHDFGEFDVIISLNGSVYDYLDRVPFHTSAQRWDLSGTGEGDDELANVHRSLRAKTEQLMDLLVGDEVA